MSIMPVCLISYVKLSKMDNFISDFSGVLDG